jgi:hypothetical protein
MRRAEVATELRAIAKAHGGVLRAEDVVSSAAPKTSPLHDLFTWDDTEAARQYRLWQARQIIRVNIEVVKGTEKRNRVFVSLVSDRVKEQGGYRPMVAVLTDANMRKELLQNALDELERITAKYEALTELADVFAAIKKARAKAG